MFRIFIILSLTGLLTAAEQATTLQTVGIRVATLAKKTDGTPLPLAILSARPGTDIALLLTSKEPIAQIEPDLCQLTTATDEQGTDLSKPFVPAALRLRPPPLARKTYLSADRKQMILDWHLPGIPAPGSRTVKVDGLLALRVGGEVKTSKVNIPIQANAVVNLDGLQLRITEVIESDWDVGYREAYIDVIGPKFHLEKLEVLDANGNDLESVAIITDAGNPDAFPVLAIPGGLKNLDLQIIHRQGSRVIKVPVAIDTGLGVDPVF